jgi:hypothetical protein
MSLGRAFLAARAESVTVSLWQVSDDSIALLIEKYYKAFWKTKRKAWHWRKHATQCSKVARLAPSFGPRLLSSASDLERTGLPAERPP